MWNKKTIKPLNNSKRSINSAAESSTAKIQKKRLDDDDAVALFAQRSIHELEKKLYDKYIVNDEQPLQEDDGVEDDRDVVGSAADG